MTRFFGELGFGEMGHNHYYYYYSWFCSAHQFFVLAGILTSWIVLLTVMFQ